MDVNRDDPESVDAQSGDPGVSPLDLTPRETAPRPAGRPGVVRRFVPWVLAVAVLGGIGVMVSNLAGATTYFYNVDQALEKRSDIGDRRVRVQGNIVAGSVDQGADYLRFTLRYHDRTLRVSHTGDVPDLFGPAIPVVIEGNFTGDSFSSDRVLVKHDEKYEEKNSQRVKEAEADAESVQP